MSNNKIKNVEEVLRSYVGPDKKIIDVQLGPLIGPGENYSSVLYKLDVKLKDENDGKEEWLYTVAKQIPENEKARIMCDIQVSVKKEIAMFDTILPALQELQREHGVKNVVNYLPKLYGWRLNLHGKDDVVDDDAVIIMENLKESGYINVDRFVGLDEETTELILKDLAAFHALPVALKLKKPEVFEKKIKPFLTPHRPPHPPKKDKKSPGDSHDWLILEVLQEDYKCIPYISKIKQKLNGEIFSDVSIKEPFASISHGDLWINNAMVRFENGKPVENKLIDFQFYDYNSPARDLLFFLTTSVQKRVLERSFDDLVRFYHNEFIAHLQKMGCDIGPFGLNKFLEELDTCAVSDIKRCLIFILFIVMGKGGPSPGFYPGKPLNMQRIKENMTLEAKEKAWFLIQLCGKKGWL